MSKLEVDAIEPQSGTTLTLGASGDTIALASGVTSGSGMGKVLQVVQATTTTETIVSSTTYTDTTLSGSITPSSTSSKILISVHQGVDVFRSDDLNFAGIRLLRGSTVVFDPNVESSIGPASVGVFVAAASEIIHRSIFSFSYIDSPNSSSEVTYKTQGRPFSTADSGSVSFQPNGTNNDQSSIITLMEIAG